MVLLTGGSSIIPHVDTFFRDKLKVEVDYLNPFENVSVSAGIDVDRVNEDLQSLGEVVGLALRRALTCPVEINLMPPDLVSRKEFRRRVPFFALAAGGVFLTMLCWWVYFYRMGVMLETRCEDVKSEISKLDGLQKRLSIANKKYKVASERLDTIENVVGLRSRWSKIISAINSCMQEGMWIVGVTPRNSAGEIAEIDITVQAFSDCLIDNDKGTATERFRDHLRATSLFGDETEIIKEGLVESYLRRFTIRLKLKEPLAVKR
jgi:hypothetical protein